MSFEILVGGKVPEKPPGQNEPVATETLPTDAQPANFAEINRQISTDTVLMDHWNFCRYKSPLEKSTIKGCCGSSPREILSYNCRKLGIQQIHPLICGRCSHYQKMEEKNETA